MSTTTTSNLSLTIPTPGSGEPWDTDLYNKNFEAIDAAAGSDRTRLTNLETKLPTSQLILASSTYGTNWTAGGGATDKPRISRVGPLVFLSGAMVFGSSAGGGGYATIITIPAEYRPPSGTIRVVGSTVIANSSGTALGVVNMTIKDGVIGTGAAPGYSTVSMPFSTIVPFALTWSMD